MIDPATDAAPQDPAVPHRAAADPPAVARRRLRLALRRAREAKNYTRGQVANALDWSLSKINRIEGGEVTISTADLKALLTYLDITDNDTIERLVADARAARRHGWLDDPRYRPHLTPATQQLIQFEGEATTIKCFSPALIPGIAQTREYGAAILDFWSGELSAEARAVRLEVRLKRIQHVFGRTNPPKYLIILDESVILRELGGARVAADQLKRVLELIHGGYIRVRIVPLEAGAGGMTGPFALYSFDDGTVLYTESQLWDSVIQVSELVTRQQRTFDLLWRHALDEEASSRLITARYSTVLASLDRTDKTQVDS